MTLAQKPNSVLESQLFSAVRDCLFNIFAAAPHLHKTCYIVVTGPTKSRSQLWLEYKYTNVKICSDFCWGFLRIPVT